MSVKLHIEHLRFGILIAIRSMQLPRPSRVLRLAATLLLATHIPFACASAEVSEPKILVGDSIRVPEGGETALTIAIEPSSAIPMGSRTAITIHDVPITFSAGFERGSTWLLQLSELKELKIRSARGVSGKGRIFVYLIDAEREVLAIAHSEVIVEPNAATAVPQAQSEVRQPDAAKPSQTTSPAGGNQIAVPAPGKASVSQHEANSEFRPLFASRHRVGNSTETRAIGESAQTAAVAPNVTAVPLKAQPPTEISTDIKAQWQRLIELGERQIALGNIGIARRYFVRAAEAGSAMGVLKLAETYDAEILLNLRTIGVKPDPKEAQRWYERAAQLGAPEAAERLKRIKQTLVGK